MTDPDKLTALAARCEASPALQDDGGYKLDGDIARTLGWTYRQREGAGGWGWNRPGLPDHFNASPPAYSTSLDAAMTLVPEGWEYLLMNGNGYHEATFTNHVLQRTAWAAGETLPLAICAAALRARAQSTETRDAG